MAGRARLGSGLTLLLAALAAAPGASGCGGCRGDAEPVSVPPVTGAAGARGSAGPAGAGNGDARPQGPTGVVEGTVVLADGAAMPAYPESQIFRAPGDPVPHPAECPPPNGREREPVRRDGEGLRNVLVALSEFGETEAGGSPQRASAQEGTPDPGAPPGGSASPPPYRTRPPETHEVVIRDCLLDPPFLAATVGDTVRLRNDSAYPFIPRIPGGFAPAPGQSGGAIAQALLTGQTREFVVSSMGPTLLTCSVFGAPCGRADVLTLGHTLHAVTGAGGRFRIEDVPAGREVEVHAWHPLFEDTMVKVTVAPGETRTLTLTLRPAAIDWPQPEPPRPPRDPRLGDIY